MAFEVKTNRSRRKFFDKVSDTQPNATSASSKTETKEEKEKRINKNIINESSKSSSFKKSRFNRVSIGSNKQEESDYNKRRRERLSVTSSEDDVSVPKENISNIFKNKKKKDANEFPFNEQPYTGDALLTEDDMVALKNARRFSNATLNNMKGSDFAFDVAFPMPDKINDNQVRYPGLAQKDKITALIPEAIYESTYKSLQELNNIIKEEYKKGSVEEFVADNMSWNLEEINEKLTPEQIDSVAMGMVAIDRSSAMLVADVTGFGKGRTMATLLVYGIKVKGIALFLSEKVNLFSDIWRDIVDIGCEDRIGRPFIINDNAKIINLKTRKEIFPRWKSKEHKQILKSGKVPDGCKLILSTYSQFGIKDTNKRDFIKKAISGGHIATDEVQNISRQEANVTQFMTDVMSSAGSVIDASASSGQDIDNLRSYGRIFPWLTSNDYESLDKEKQVWASGESVIAAVREKRILRRETDISGMEIEMDTRENHHGHMIKMQNHFAEVMKMFGVLDARIAQWCYKQNESNREEIAEWKFNAKNGIENDGPMPKERTWYPFSFGGRLNILCTHFITCLMAPMAIDMIEDSIKSGKRPVVVLDSTMENIMKNLMEDEEESKTEEEVVVDEDGEEEVISEDGDHNKNDAPPTFRDMLIAVLNKVPYVSLREKGKRKAEKIDISNQVPDYEEYYQDCLDIINEFPILDISPLDIIREEIEYRGQNAFKNGDAIKPWKVGEISGRKMRIVNGSYETIPKEEIDRNALISRFNFNDIQKNSDDGNDITVMLMTRSGSTGLSMHDAPQFPGPYKRHMFDFLPPSSTKQRLQMYGRTERRGSRTKCLYTTISTPLPWHYFTLISQNKKMEALAASVSGTKDSSIGHKDLPDFLNRTGDRVAQTFLERNRDLMFRMRIKSMDDDEEARRKLYYVSTLFRRLAMLTYEEQTTVIKSYMDAFSRTANSDSFSLSSYLHGRWQVGESWVVEHGSKTGTTRVDRNDLVIARIHRKVDMPTLNYDEIESYIEKRADLWDRIRMGEFNFWRKYILSKNNMNKYLSRFTNGSVEDIERLKMDKRSAVYSRFVEVNTAAGYMKNIWPGRYFYGSNEEGDTQLGVILDVDFPENVEDAFEYFQYVIKYALPGDYRVRSTTLEDMLTNKRVFRICDTIGYNIHAINEMKREFRRDRSDVPTTITFHALVNNVNKGILLGERMEEGRYVNFRTEDGRLRSAILIPESRIVLMTKTDIRVQTPEAAIAYLQKTKGAELFTYSRNRSTQEKKGNMSTYIAISGDSGKKNFTVSMPDNDIHFAKFAKKEWLCKFFDISSKALIEKNKELKVDGQKVEFILNLENIKAFIEEMYKNGDILFANGKKRKTINRLLSNF